MYHILRQASHWLRDAALPSLLIVLGAVILGRLVSWTGLRYRRSLHQDVLDTISAGGVASERAKRARALTQAIEWTVLAVIYFVAGLLALRQLGVPLTSMIAPATVAGVAVGFGAQQMVGDLLAGFFLFAEHQFGVGDLVRLSTPGQLTGITGIVEELTLRVTKIRSQQGDLIVIPNSALRQVTNLSKDWSRVVIDVPIPVGEDLPHVIDLLGRVATDMANEDRWRPQILGDPVVAGVETIEVEHVNLRLLVRTLPGRQFDVGRELRLRVAMALHGEGINTPTATTTTDGSG